MRPLRLAPTHLPWDDVRRLCCLVTWCQTHFSKKPTYAVLAAQLQILGTRQVWVGVWGLFFLGNNALGNSSLLLVSWSPENRKKPTKDAFVIISRATKGLKRGEPHWHPVKGGGGTGRGDRGRTRGAETPGFQCRVFTQPCWWGWSLGCP